MTIVPVLVLVLVLVYTTIMTKLSTTTKLCIITTTSTTKINVVLGVHKDLAQPLLFLVAFDLVKCLFMSSVYVCCLFRCVICRYFNKINYCSLPGAAVSSLNSTLRASRAARREE